MNDVFYGLKKNHLFTGRGATAIYLSLCNERIRDSLVLLPGNICYAAIYPVIAAGNEPLFCDVEPDTGNIGIGNLKEFSDHHITALVLPHMYGNHVRDIREIKEWCKERHVILIEDCASSLGSCSNDGVVCGTYGDYVIYSYGYSKIMDLGNGGLLASDRDLSRAADVLKTLPEFDDLAAKEQQAFSREYRNVRYHTHDYSKLKAMLSDRMFLYRLADGKIEEGIDDPSLIEASIRKHLDSYALYDRLLDSSFRRYPYGSKSVPWRFSLLLDKDVRKKVIGSLLKEGLPVSDWYPNVTEIFMDQKMELRGVDAMEASIINLPLDIDEEKIRNICFNINMTGVEQNG